MKKIISAILVILIIVPAMLFLTACRPTQETTLVWLIPYISPTIGIPGYPLVEEWERAVASAIRERGASFNVRIAMVGSSENHWRGGTLNNHTWFTDLIIEGISNGQQGDIFTVFSNPSSGTSSVDAYFQLYQAGLTLQLCDFLESDEGAKVYEKFPPVVWDALRINGEVHGFFGELNSRLGTTPVVALNREIAAEMDTSQITNCLATLSQLLPNDRDVSMQKNTMSSEHSFFFNMQNILPGVVQINGEVSSFFENYLVERFLYGSYNIPTWTWSWTSDDEENVAVASTKAYTMCDCTDCSTLRTWETFFVGEPDVFSETSAIVINGQSEHTTEALQLLNWLQTDPEFANIFSYGKDGVHVRYENGTAYNLLCGTDTTLFPDLFETFFPMWGANFGALFTRYPAHSFVCVPCPNKVMEHLWSLESAPHTGFRFDRRGWEELILELQLIQWNYTMDGEFVYSANAFTSGQDPNWRETLANLNADLRAAGIGELIEEVQRQYDEWFALHSPVNR